MLKQLSDNLHRRLLGRSAIPMPPTVEAKIAGQVKRFFPQGLSDNSVPIELPLPENAPDVNTLDALITEQAMEYINQVLAWLDVSSLIEPSNWNCPVGWSRWYEGRWVKEAPPAGCRIVDIEAVPVEYYKFSETGDPTAVKWIPVCAIALGINDLYVWRESTQRHGDGLYPGVPGISIGHNISYDDQYSLLHHKPYMDNPSDRPVSVDTFGLWQVCRGHSNQQRPFIASDGWVPEWVEETAPASLSDVHEFYFGEALNKGVRDELVNQGWSYYCDNVATVLKYCYDDCVATAEVLQALLPEWIEANTYHGKTEWLTLWAMMTVSTAWIPIDEQLHSVYFDNAESSYQAIRQELNGKLADIAWNMLDTYSEVVQYQWDVIPDDEAIACYPVKDKYCNVYLNREATEQDELLFNELDWTPARSGKNKGQPAWFRKFMKKPSYAADIAPILLGMTWRGHLLRYSEADGYYYLEENDRVKVPNPNKRGKPVHSMFMKDFMNDGVLDARISASTGDAQAFIERIHSLSIWTSLRKRVRAIQPHNVEGFYVLKDKLAWGTITRRYTSPFSQVLPKMDKPGRVGSNVRALVKAPEGYKLVWVDFDNQEASLSAEFGDADLIHGKVGYRGSSAFSLSCHCGEKAAKTTIHYLLSLSARIGYTLAKNINYGVLYGLSLLGIINYFLMANKDMEEPEAKQRGQSTLNTMKGIYDKGSGLYSNGTASATFNNLRRLVLSHEPRGVLSHQRMSKALAQARGEFATTKQNWFIQESGSAMRDRLVVYTRYWMEQLGVRGRLVVTVHDEAIFCVDEDDAALMTYICQLAHLYIVAWKTLTLNLDCLPAGQAYFSSVEVDTRWRKDVTANPPNTPDMQGVVWEPGVSYTPAQTAQWASM